jgi:chromosome segregation protein
MKIKKLELVGFKSFVDRTIVHFDHDVLGIVGPNGCGKSNIVDAIRWAMGEQSAKHLRGKAMQDVIFNGSETRAANEFAEVTLTFENDDPTDVPLEYKDYPEIAVTRRLERSGDSDYLINKTPVRLKDITDLFLGTGVGTKAYSIVEQGKIGLIVSAKPEDRRVLIEEAAGITKFKSKKKQAEQKMELTTQNLLRVGDIVAEIERNIGSLKRQAAKAERFLSYRAEIEDLQLYEASHRWLEIVGWTKLEGEEVARLAVETEEARTLLAGREAELESLRLEVGGAEEKLEQAHNANFAAENAVKAEEGAIARAEDKIAVLGNREAAATAELAEIEDKKGQLAVERESVAVEVEGLEEEERGQAEQMEEAEARLAEVTFEQQKADVLLGELRKKNAEAQSTIAGAEAKLAGFDRRRSEMLARMEKWRAEREELEGGQIEHAARARELEQSVEDLKSGKTTSAEDKVRLEQALAVLRGEITGSERLLDEAKSEASRKRSRLHALNELQSKLEGVGGGAKALLATKDESLQGLVADKVEAPPELTQALAGLLGHRLEDVVVSDMDRGVALLHKLAEGRLEGQAGKKARASIVPRHIRFVAGACARLLADYGVVARLIDELRYLPEDEALVRSLVGDALVVRDVEAAMRLRGRVDAPLVTLGGTVVYPDGRISGGTGEEVVAHMLDTKREARELAGEVERLDLLVTERLTAHQALRQSISEASTALERARHEAHQSELALVTTEKDLRAAQTALEQVRRRLETLVAEMQDLAELLNDAAGEREEAQQALDATRGILEDIGRELSTAEDLSVSWRAQVEARRQVVTERKVRVAGSREKLAAAKGTAQRLTRSVEELELRSRRLDEELRSSEGAKSETMQQLLEHKELLAMALDQAKLAADELAQVRSVFEGLRAELQEREALLKELRQRAASCKEELTAHEMKLREQQIAMTHLLEGVAEKFRGLHLPRIVGDHHMKPPPDEDTRARIHELTNLLDRMGSVNLEAVKEHEEAEKRYTFYSEQKADLDKALADLTMAIAQMNRESKKLFEETFHAVNAKFQEIFPRMFRGGQASLKLTNPEDMLETGIDILAQPPGKKLSSIELMSGGEKALTAVSLIFAIFQIKPSPFCILDEVDAPLDEANVARYNETVRSMTDRSQFILITHIKRTMQMVDVLYGVTMQERGVSRLVSVKLNEGAEKKKAAPAAAAPEIAVA